MLRHYRALIVVIALAVSVPALGACFSHDTSLSDLQQRGTIRVGYAVEPPYAFLMADGEVSGIFPIVSERLVRDLEIAEIEWIQTDFDALIPGLESGRFDVIAAGMYITPERAERVAFSEPLLHVQQGLLVQDGNPKQLRSYQQVAGRSDIRLAVLAGAVEEDLLRALGIPEQQIVVVPDASTGRAAVEAGVVDGLALSSPTIRWMAARDELGQTDVVQPFEQPAAVLTSRNGYAAFAFRPSDRRLVEAWNTVLRSFVGSAEHLQVMAVFGFAETELPGSITTAEILAP